MKKHVGKIQGKAYSVFLLNLLDLSNTITDGYFCGCPPSLLHILGWLFAEAKDRSLEMRVNFCDKQKISEGQYRLWIGVVCNGREVEFETFTTSVDRVALVKKPHGSVVFLNLPHADDNLCDFTSLCTTELWWAHISNNTVLDGWLEKRRSIERERRLAVMMGTHPRLGVNAWKCRVTTASNAAGR